MAVDSGRAPTDPRVRARGGSRPPRLCAGAVLVGSLLRRLGVRPVRVGAYALGRSAGAARATGALVLAGVPVAAFMTAMQTFVQQQHADTLRDVYAWILGGFTPSGWSDVVIAGPYIVLSSLVLMLHRR